MGRGGPLVAPSARAAAAGQGRVGRPPFAFRIEGPDDWVLLETAQATWRGSVERLLDQHAGTPPMPASLRRRAVAVFEEVVAATRQTGVLLCLAKLAWDGRGRPFCGSLTLSWLDSTPVAAHLAFARLIAGPADRLEELDTPSGRALLCGEVVQAPPGELFPGGRAWSSQAYVPVAGTTWTALISGTASGEHAQLLGRLVRRMAGSLSVDLPQRPRAGLWYPLQQLTVGAEDERQGR
jgi:hypothetical protein